MKSEIYTCGEYSDIIIKDNTSFYSTVDLKQGDKPEIRVFMEELDDFIDGLIIIRNHIQYMDKPR